METNEQITIIEYLNNKEKLINMHYSSFSTMIEYLRKNNYIINERIFDSPRTNEEFNIFKLIVLDQEKYYCVVFTFFNSIEMERTIEWIYDDILKIICFKGNIQVNEIV